MPAPVLTHEHLEQIGAAHGRHASWAVWAGTRHRPSNAWLGDLSVLDTRADPRRLLALHRDVVIVAHDAGGPRSPSPAPAWSAFHDPADATGRSSLLAGATRGTPAWGSYLTPLLKQPRPPGDGARPRPGEVEDGLAVLRDELELLGGDPVLVCLGEQVGSWVSSSLGRRHVVRTVDPGRDPRSRKRLHTELAGVLAGRTTTAAR